jgi:hypothetical protein
VRKAVLIWEMESRFDDEVFSTWMKELTHCEIGWVPAILAVQEAEIRRIKASPRKIVLRPYLKKTHHTKKGLVEWVKV